MRNGVNYNATQPSVSLWLMGRASSFCRRWLKAVRSQCVECATMVLLQYKERNLINIFFLKRGSRCTYRRSVKWQPSGLNIAGIFNFVIHHDLCSAPHEVTWFTPLAWRIKHRGVKDCAIGCTVSFCNYLISWKSASPMILSFYSSEMGAAEKL